MERRKQRCSDGLMGGAVLAYADGVMGKDIDYGQLHKSRHAHCVLHIVGEHKEGSAQYGVTPPWR